MMMMLLRPTAHFENKILEDESVVQEQPTRQSFLRIAAEEYYPQTAATDEKKIDITVWQHNNSPGAVMNALLVTISLIPPWKYYIGRKLATVMDANLEWRQLDRRAAHLLFAGIVDNPVIVTS